MAKIKIADIRAKFPMYADLSDDDLLIGIRKKFYADIPMSEFSKRIEYTPVDPTEGMSGLDKFRAGIGKALTDVGRGVGQMVGAVDRADVAESRKQDAALMNTGAGTAGNLVGNLAALAPSALIPGAATIPGAAAIGAATGLLQPSTSTGETLQNTGIGAVVGPAGVLAGRGLAAGYQGLKALAEPFTQAGRSRIAGRVLQEFAADPAAVQAARSVPSATGARPMLSEAARDTGIASLERSLAQQDPQVAAALAQRAMDNNAARVGVIQGIAGDDASRAAAQAAREAASSGMYSTATNATYQVDDALAELLRRPAVKQAMARAQTLAANQGRPFSFGVDGHDVMSGLGNSAKGPQQQITGRGLQDLKMAMDEMLSDPASGFTGKAGGTIKELRGQIVQWMEKANPDFKAARQSYAATSKPINAMDVGQRLLDKTTANVRDLSGNQRLQANAFARALNDEQSLVRQATGFKGVNALADVLTPQQMAGVNAVREELELAANLASAANGPGSQTAKSLASQNLLRRIIGPTGMPQSWSESALLQGLARPIQFAMKTAEPKIQNRLAEILLDPQQAATVMEMARALPVSSRIGAVAEPFLPQVGLNVLANQVAQRTQ